MRALILAFTLVLAALPGPAHALLVLSYHDIRDDVAPKGDADRFAVSTRNFAMHLDWLRAQGYTAVSAQQVIDARAGRTPLPAKAVLLTFDDGLRSTYTHAFPLLRAYGMPALVAVTSSWIEMPAGQRVPYGPRDFTGDDFLTWAQLREMRESGVFEIASHSHAMHEGIAGNPQGNAMPAAITRRWTPAGYEAEAAWRARIAADLDASAAAIREGAGAAPRVIVWPYAAYNDAANALAAERGMGLSFDLEGRALELDLAQQAVTATDNANLRSLARLLIYNNPDVRDLAHELRRDITRSGVRAIQVDLDYVYDADPAQAERNLGTLVERIKQIGPSHVFLQAFADPDGDGAADATYFPNRHLPMRADLFNRVAWQLQTRAGVRVFAWMPVLGWTPGRAAGAPRTLAAEDAKDIPRLDPTDPRTRAWVGDLYEDLAVAAPFTGLLFHDDAYLRESELPALPRAARTPLLVELTHALRDRAERWRPKLVTARNLFAAPVLDPAAEAWFAQRLEAFNAAYDYTALMAMPAMEGAPDARAWLDALAGRVAASPRGLERTLFELQAVDWRHGRAMPDDTLKAQARQLLARGVRHLGYYPDRFLEDAPPLDDAREAMSVREFPYIER